MAPSFPPLRRRLLGLLLATLTVACGGEEPPRSFLLATTTSVRDSGLLDELLPEFERRSGRDVDVVAVGTGAALRMGTEGNADALLTHAPAAEEALVERGALLSRRPFMENHFTLAGPAEDPAGLAESRDGADAFRKLAAAGAPYVSRDDDSGTHKREIALMVDAGIDPQIGWEAIVRTGTGMGLTLQVAGERRAYVLSDLGTFLAFQERTDLVPLTPASDDLRNVYSVLQVDATIFPGTESELARDFERYLLSEPTQRRIAEYGQERFGKPLFRPLAVPGSATGS